MSYEAKLKAMGYTIEPIELNAGRLMHAVRSGNLIYTSGQVSRWDGAEVMDKSASSWRVTEDALVASDGRRLPRLPAYRAFWFGWYAAYPQTRLIR